MDLHPYRIPSLGVLLHGGGANGIGAQLTPKDSLHTVQEAIPYYLHGGGATKDSLSGWAT